MSDPWLAVASRTVAGAAEQFERLKATAREMDAAARARGRGYFTPAEDEAVRHMLVTYTASRAALLELITSTELDRRAASSSDEAERRAFIGAYAAAAVLVDAARFLRDLFDDNDVVRRKLNEAEPAFAIPAGTYDAVIASLTDPRHAWRLHQANTYFDTHRADLAALAKSDTSSARLLSLIDHLRDRLDVSKSAYAKARLKYRARELADAQVRPVKRAVYAVQEAVSRLMSHLYVKPGAHPALPDAIKQQLVAMMRPGDVMITRKEHAITNYFLPGYWPHGALYLGNADDLTRLGLADHEHVRPAWPRITGEQRVPSVYDDGVDPPADGPPRRALEALKDGVWVRGIASPLTCDAIAVIRPRLTEPDVAAGLARALRHEGKAYDYDFDFTRSDRLVCTEVVYRAFDGVADVSLKLNRRAGRMTLAAEDLLDDALHVRHFEMLATYCPQRSDALLTGDDMAQTLRATMAPREPSV